MKDVLARARSALIAGKARLADSLPKEKIGHAATHITKSAHFVYFGAAAIGAHDLYALAAAVIVVFLSLAYILRIPLEGG